MNTRALAVLVVAASGCSLHVVVPDAPAASSPLAARDAYYEDVKPLGIAGAPSPYGASSDNPFPALQLANGKRVADPMDLLPAIDDDSATAVAARNGQNDATLGNGLVVIGAVVLGVSTAGLLIGEVALLGGAGGDPSLGTAVFAGSLAFAGAGTAGLIGGQYLEGQAEGEKMSAFFLYERDLRRRLKLVRPEEAIPLEQKWSVPHAPAPAATLQPNVVDDPAGP